MVEMWLFSDDVDGGTMENWSHHCGGDVLSDISHQVLARHLNMPEFIYGLSTLSKQIVANMKD